ncbi:MAG: DUF6036 family nucleotidyltransferase, partial [Gaiellaceae bacterium]
MKRSEFDHLVRAAAAIVDDELVVIGSQAILGQYPDPPEDLLRSVELDVFPRNHPDRADEIDGAIGAGSRFHETYDYYARGVGPETPIAPAGWEGRLVPVELPAMRPKDGTVKAWCMEVHDLVLAKIAAGRPHDVEFVTEAIRSRLVDQEQLDLGVELMPESHRELAR